MKLRNKIENLILKKYLRAIILKDVISEDKIGRIILDGEFAELAKIKNLKEEAKLIQGTELWSILTNTLLAHADELMKKKSTCFEDVRHAKMMMYNISLQESIIKKLLKYKTEK